MNQDETVVVISGGSRGLGAALVETFLNEGSKVGAFSRSLTPFLERVQKQSETKNRFYWSQVDSKEPSQLRRFVKEVLELYGRIDLLVNNVAIGADGMLTLMSDQVLENSVRVNLTSTLQLTRACLKPMLMNREGSIVNISSINAIRGHAGVVTYSATKAALDGMTRSLAREVGRRNVRVNSVAPGYFESDMTESLGDAQKKRILRRTPLNRLVTIQDIVCAVRFLASSQAAMITGQTIVVDGGATV